ncbi:MAG: branched-chain amino acid ABC transporter permease [Deltaproteobacteria bacterium]|nr:branched-chain amino acid ABC transporter permease [Deltaproteobacteria bacterium]
MNPALTQRFPGIRLGLIGGVSLVLLSLIGMVETFNQREIISDLISMGQTLLLLTAVFIAYLAAKRGREHGRAQVFGASITAGLIMAGMLTLLVLLGQAINMRQVFINASPVLFQILIFQQEELWAGIGLLLLAGALIGFSAALLCLLPHWLRRVITTGLCSVAGVGLLQDLIAPILSDWSLLADFTDLLFPGNGLSISGAVGLFIVVAALSALWSFRGQALQTRIKALPPQSRRGLNFAALLAGALVMLVLPQVLGLFLSEVMTIVGLYILLGLGLNIVVGFAGLLDLGYVAFFAIGSYTVAILTSPELGFFDWNFWQALPLAVLFGVLAGVILGVPVLKMRGDYLAIATLGFGEIIRIMVLSDFLRPWLGGAQGIGKIPKAAIGGFEFATPQEIYYLILAGCALVGFISWRLRDSRLGRAWMAVREDEDVAQAMGIELVATKLLAFATGAGFSALSGAIFATKLGSVYPHSFNVMISINILCVIIVGGMGSMPGVAVGAIALVGLPELLREFAEYRLLVYGAALMAMMLLRPEGLWPEATRQRELHEEEDAVRASKLAEGSAGPRS